MHYYYENFQSELYFPWTVITRWIKNLEISRYVSYNIYALVGTIWKWCEYGPWPHPASPRDSTDLFRIRSRRWNWNESCLCAYGRKYSVTWSRKKQLVLQRCAFFLLYFSLRFFYCGALFKKRSRLYPIGKFTSFLISFITFVT